MLEPSHNLVIDSYDGCPHFCFGYDEPMPKPEWIIMQFTGLKDKNGKEIYEGDIIRCYGSYPLLVVHGKYGWEVEWTDIQGKMKEKVRCPITDDLALLEQLEVIGNIYETPELLK